MGRRTLLTVKLCTAKKNVRRISLVSLCLSLSRSLSLSLYLSLSLPSPSISLFVLPYPFSLSHSLFPFSALTLSVVPYCCFLSLSFSLCPSFSPLNLTLFTVILWLILLLRCLGFRMTGLGFRV